MRCAFFRNYQRRLSHTLENGQQVLIQAQVSLYETRGDFQLIVTTLQLAGDGALQLAFEHLKKKLDKEGLFSPEFKKPLPPFPRVIGVITSPSGAAIRDILKVIHRRFPIPIIIYPTLMQGDKAAAQIVDAIQCANRRQECDVILLARGGGSLEDLWPFNEVAVARAIFASQIPIVTGIGHEIDFTIADFVADCRAATPSAAAEQVTPHRAEWLKQVTALHHQLSHWMEAQLRHRTAEIKHLRAVVNGLNPLTRIQQARSNATALTHRLLIHVQHDIRQKQQAITGLARALDAISPLTTLNRGYAIVMQNDNIIREAKAVCHGDRIIAKLSKGSLDCIVDRIHQE